MSLWYSEMGDAIYFKHETERGKICLLLFGFICNRQTFPRAEARFNNVGILDLGFVLVG